MNRVQPDVLQPAPWALRSLEDQSACGRKLTFESSFWPSPGGKYQNQDMVQEVTYQPGLYVNFDVSGSTGAGALRVGWLPDEV